MNARLPCLLLCVGVTGLTLSGSGREREPVVRTPSAAAKGAHLDPKYERAIAGIRSSTRGRVLIVDCHGWYDHDTIQGAIDAASDGDVVVVLPNTCNGEGVYFENISFVGKAITVQSTSPANLETIESTIISGNHAGSVVTFAQDEGRDTVLRGFTITEGFSFMGAGIYCASSPTISHCLIRDNYTFGVPDGGCGGGIYCGGAALIRDCVVSGNASSSGGGLCVDGSGNPTIVNCTVVGNISAGWEWMYGGGAGLASWGSGDVGLYSSLMWNNYAFGIDSYRSESIAVLWGSGLPSVRYCDIAGGEAGVIGPVDWGPGNIDADPVFLVPWTWDDYHGWVEGDYHLLSGSPCVDAGDPGFVGEKGETDIDGDPRVVHGRVDIGADEFVGGIVSSEPPGGAIDARQPTDVDGSNVYGWSEVVLTFDTDVTGLTPDDFTVTLDPPAAPPFLAFVSTDGPTATLQFGDFAPDPFPPGHWTIITHNASDTSRRFGYLPADVNADRTSSPRDILALIDAFNGVGEARPIWSTDMNRSGGANPADILRLIDLLNGGDETEGWNGRTLPD